MAAVADKLLLGFFGDSVQVKNYNCNDYLPQEKVCTFTALQTSCDRSRVFSRPAAAQENRSIL